jgi:hypothetical protein
VIEDGEKRFVLRVDSFKALNLFASMRNYKITVKLFHESFGGYDHCDGEKTYNIRASNDKAARNKALKKAGKESGGWGRIIEMEFYENNNFFKSS